MGRDRTPSASYLIVGKPTCLANARAASVKPSLREFTDLQIGIQKTYL